MGCLGGLRLPRAPKGNPQAEKVQEDAGRHHDTGDSCDLESVLLISACPLAAPHAQCTPRHLVVPMGAAPWPVMRGLAVDLAFVAGFGRERLPLIWGILGSRVEAQARDTVPRPGQGGQVSQADGTSPATPPPYTPLGATLPMGTKMSVPVRLGMHLHVCVQPLTYVGVGVNLHVPCQHGLAHMCTRGYRNAQGYPGMLAQV